MFVGDIKWGAVNVAVVPVIVVSTGLLHDNGEGGIAAVFFVAIGLVFTGIDILFLQQSQPLPDKMGFMSCWFAVSL
ncbi:hypothetical protein APT95_11315 [Providencia stuartii]|nr:hypothetical protein APT95_11315 [Providencia stuartii]